MPPKKYNTTQLRPANDFERHVYHRDTFAHYMRWTHAIKHLKRDMKVLDFGCGSGEFAEVIYRNRFKSKKYLGYDVRKSQIQLNNEKFEKQDWIHFEEKDLVEPFEPDDKYDLITSFEVIEHIGKYNGKKYLDNLHKHCHKDTTILLSTPCYDEKVGAAKNHMIYNPETKQKEVGEFTYDELKTLLEDKFTIEKVYGTFASQKDYIPHLNEWQKKLFDEVKHYFDSTLLSNLMAPLFPEHSRNCIWRLKAKI